jgi:hypothetical protein
MIGRNLYAVQRPDAQSNQQRSEPQLYNFTTEEAHSIHKMEIHMDVHVMYATTDKT